MVNTRLPKGILAGAKQGIHAVFRNLHGLFATASME
jgi:hypothetical protein